MYLYVLAGIGLTAVIFAADVLVSPLSGVDYLYILPLLLFQQPNRRPLYIISPVFFLAVMTAAALMERTPSVPLYLAADNRSISFVILAIVTILNYRRQNLEALLRRRAFEAWTLAENLPDAVARFDRSLKCLYANAPAAMILGKRKEEIQGMRIAELPMPEVNRTSMAERIQGVFSSGRPFAGEAKLRLPGDEKYLTVRYVPEIDITGGISTVLAIYVDISCIKKSEEHIRYLSFHDKATDLYNWNFFSEESRRLDTARGLPISVIMLDLNNLKLSNDIFGHQEGDKLLKLLADSIKKSCRTEDVVARWGGDEFVILLPNTVRRVAETIIRRIKDTCAASRAARIPCSISAGTAVKERQEENLNAIIRLAEERMYKNKVLESAASRKEIIAMMLARLTNIETRRHLDRLEVLAQETGDILDLPRKQRGELILFSTLHDVGKTALPDSLLDKSTPLTSGEWEQMKRHPELGARIARSLPELAEVAEEILLHHERWDGSGYPKGLKDDQIPLLVRILSILDAYDTMVHGRPYKKSLTHEEAVEELRKGAGRQFDPDLVELIITRVFSKIHAPSGR